MSDMQKFWIKRLLLKDSDLLMQLETEFNNKDKKDVDSEAAAAAVASSSSNSSEWKRLQSLLAQLRKAANHPYLFKYVDRRKEYLRIAHFLVSIRRLIT